MQYREVIMHIAQFVCVCVLPGTACVWCFPLTMLACSGGVGGIFRAIEIGARAELQAQPSSPGSNIGGETPTSRLYTVAKRRGGWTVPSPPLCCSALSLSPSPPKVLQGMAAVLTIKLGDLEFGKQLPVVGGSGAVYKGRWKSRTVAIKTLTQGVPEKEVSG